MDRPRRPPLPTIVAQVCARECTQPPAQDAHADALPEIGEGDRLWPEGDAGVRCAEQDPQLSGGSDSDPTVFSGWISDLDPRQYVDITRDRESGRITNLQIDGLGLIMSGFVAILLAFFEALVALPVGFARSIEDLLGAIADHLSGLVDALIETGWEPVFGMLDWFAQFGPLGYVMSLVVAGAVMYVLSKAMGALFRYFTESGRP